MSLQIARLVRACQILILAAVPVVGGASEPLTLHQAMAWSLQRNPDLAAFGFELKSQQHRIQQARLQPPLELSIDVEDVLGSGRLRGADAAQGTFALSQVIELGGKREARVAVQDQQRQVLQIQQQARQLDVLAEVTRRYLHVASDQARLQLAQRATALSEQTIRAAERRVRAAKAPEVELRRARVALARAEIDLEHTEHELLTSRQQLAAMWGETDVEFESVAADLHRLPEPADFDVLIAALDDNPDRLRFVSEARLRDAEVRLAQTRATADPTLSAGVRRLQETRDTALVFGLSVPLFGSRRTAAAIDEARVLREQTDAEQTAHRLRVRTHLFELHQELRHALTEAQMLRERVLPELESALLEVHRAFERGRYGYLEWVDAQRELLDAQRALIESASNAHLYQTEIERLTGAPLAASALRDRS